MTAPESMDLIDWLTKLAKERDHLLRCANDNDVLRDKAACKAQFSLCAGKLNELCGSLEVELRKSYPLAALIDLCKNKLLFDASFASRKHYFDDLFTMPDQLIELAASVTGGERASAYAREDILGVFFESDAVELLLQKSANAYYLCEILSACQGPPQKEKHHARVVQHAVRRLNERAKNSDKYKTVMQRFPKECSDGEKGLALLEGWMLLKAEVSLYGSHCKTV